MHVSLHDTGLKSSMWLWHDFELDDGPIHSPPGLLLSFLNKYRSTILVIFGSLRPRAALDDISFNVLLIGPVPRASEATREQEFHSESVSADQACRQIYIR